ncbi:hypothetical protein SYNTR_1588 [Candidatus Syntrophocurvum alkaliphilum]|uniref:Anti-sigma-W factor RsiW n=1 Tax=Candidatus Syntrophocurvum alkaliphilum TaxID=2293317 RepID=A0A6I6DM64_9FIRM|nr:zf-HC2 domain-containing protein [Candidatus Syntrophocurvum alkaliphilum]QGU00182.1 hypothetical protein SYNTR_1588 [Candidatus Syntrophocurvum alkaliphilum]
MRCEHIRELFSPYLDEMTTEKENEAIKAHLNVCSQCREEFDHLKTVCVMMRNIENLEAPEEFSEDLKKRLMHEKVKVFGNKDIKTPRRPGWVAASVAGVALAIGIYASSFIPFKSIVASVEDWMEGESEKPQIAVEDIINRVKLQWEMSEDKDKDPSSDIIPGEVDEEPITPDEDKDTIDEDESTKEEPKDIKDEEDDKPITIAKEPEPKEVNVVTTKVRVENIEDSIREVIKIAEANTGQYHLPASDRNTMQAFDSNNVKIVSITVKEEKKDKVIEELDPLGKVGTSVSDKIVLTQEYENAVEQINSLEDQKKEITEKDELTEEEKNKLKIIENDIAKWANTKEAIEKEVNMVTVEVYLIEEMKP